MIKQRGVILKTADATLTYSEMGDIVCNSAAAITLTLPAPNSGLWYRVSNVGVGILAVSYAGLPLKYLKQGEQVLLLANNTSGWWASGGLAMSKPDMESVLTTDLIPLGGTVGQILRKNSIIDRDASWGNSDAATNGIPSGGTSGQLLSKKSNVDYDSEWVDALSGGVSGGGTPKDRIYIPNGTNLGYDDEFDDGSTSNSWSKVDTPGFPNSYYEPVGLKGLYCLVPSGKGAMKLNGLLKPIGSLVPPFYIETAVKGVSINQGYPTPGLVFTDGANYGEGVQAFFGLVINNNTTIRCQMTGFSARPSFTETPVLANKTISWYYIRVVFESANSFRMLGSGDGVVWFDITGLITYTIIPTYFGIAESTFNNSSAPLNLDWAYFRVRMGLSQNG